MPAVRFAREYICFLGAPLLHSVDPAIFSLRYFMRCMACRFCNDQCCDRGVDIDLDNVKRLLALGGGFERRVGVAGAEWFTTEPTADQEFPSGAHVRTRIRDGKCVFAGRGGRGCVIHAYCIENGLDYHTLKPLVSALFPVTFESGVLEPSSEAIDGSLVCSGDGPTLYEGAREELRYYFGDELVLELDRICRR
jgi:hypothetical protein